MTHPVQTYLTEMRDIHREVTNMARRIAALLLLEPALDESYARVKAAAHLWPGPP